LRVILKQVQDDDGLNGDDALNGDDGWIGDDGFIYRDMPVCNRLAALCAVQQLLIRQHQRHHRRDHGCAPYAYARVVAALGDYVRGGPVACDGFNWRKDGRCRLKCNTHHHRLPCGNATRDTACIIR
jgi:hypothetical protein